MEKKAVIIGAGPAGLTAAYQMLKEGVAKPVILEQEGFVGGISRTMEHNGNRIDIGGHRFFSKSEEVLRLWSELLPLEKRSMEEDIRLRTDPPAFLQRRRISRILYRRKFYDYPISLKLRTIANLGLADTFLAGMAYIRAVLIKREEISLEDFIINRFGTRLYRMFFKDYTAKVWGRDPGEISADWGKQRIRGLSLMRAILHMLKGPFKGKKVETSLIESFLYPKLGPGQYWEAMASRILELGGEIRYGAKVDGLTLADGRIAAACLSGGEVVEGDWFLSSMPVPELTAALGASVPKEIAGLADELPFRDFITVGLLTRKIKLKNNTGIPTYKDRIPDCWIYIQEPDVKVGRLQIFNNWSPLMVRDYEETIWLGLEYFCDQDDELWNMEEQDFIDMAIREAVEIGLLEREDVLDSVRIRVEKAYPAYFGSYDQFPSIREHLDSYDNLYCIGRNGQHRYNNMDHSMLTGVEAVRLIRDGLIGKDSLWNVNADQEYHEEGAGRDEGKGK